MIFYFTATGNSYDVARIIAGTTGDEMVDLGRAWKTERFGLRFRVQQGENLGFVFPVHAWSTPAIVDEFVREATFTTDNGKPYRPGYCYCVITCGAFVGGTARYFAKLLQRYHGIRLDASFSVKSVGNCVYLYDMPSADKAEQAVRAQRRQAKQVAAAVGRMHMGSEEHRNPLGSVLSLFTGREGKRRSVEKFHVDDDLCMGCGTCESVCPTNTIVIQRGRPLWAGDACTQCLACLHRCPVHATQYGNRTHKRGRYLNPALNMGERGGGTGSQATGTGRDILLPEL